MCGNTFWESTCACAHSLFIMHHIFVRFIGFPVRVTNTGPVVSLFFLQNCSKSPRSSLGRMITRIFPLLDICTCPVCSASKAKIAEYYYKYLDQKGTQFIFSDLSTYKPDQWNIYSEIRRKLVEDHNIPEKQIKFIQEANSDNARKELFKDMNSGRIRFLFGSTQKLGTGVNAQERAVAIHHLDIP